MITIPEQEKHLLPTPEQLLAEAKHIAKHDRGNAHEYKFNKKYCQGVWYWSPRHRSSDIFDFEGYVCIITTGYGGNYAGYKGTYWTRPNRLSITYHDNRGSYTTTLRFRLYEDTPFACSRTPPRNLSTILEKLDLASAHIELMSPEIRRLREEGQ